MQSRVRAEALCSAKNSQVNEREAQRLKKRAIALRQNLVRRKASSQAGSKAR